jgi:hypothetical protein
MLKSNLLCAFIALITAVTISSAFAKGYLKPSDVIVVSSNSR